MGMRGSDVTALQHDLTALGFSTAASGAFTHTTMIKLKAFQRRYRLTVDGIAGPTSIAALKRLLRSSLHIAETSDAKALTSSSEPAMPLSAADSGGVGFVPPAPTSGSATVQDATLIDGLAVPAPGTPEVIDQVLAAANRIAFRPYIYGGGHASFTAAGYDCSGSVSYALHGGGLLATPLDSEQFLNYGESGTGNWITIYTNGPTHAYMEIAGLWFDTAAQSASNGMDRWSLTRINEPPAYGTFVARHPAGW
jgi:cell wall-associated NlpC family hydrolase